MSILFISLLAGLAVIILVNEAFLAVKGLKFEKNVKERFDKVKLSEKKSALSEILFLASKIGTYLRKSWPKVFDKFAYEYGEQSIILGGNFALIEPYTFVGMQVLAGIAAAILCAVFLGIYNPLFLIAVMAGGFYLPPLFIKQQVTDKHRALFRQVPDVLDLLSFMAEAGLDLNTAMNKVVAIEKGALIDELRKVQQEVSLGKPRAEAMTDMTERLKYEPLSGVVNSLNMAAKTGGSVAPLLRTLSEQFRIERSQMAEKLAGEAPVKLLLPLALLIFPTIFLILFGPIILTFLKGGVW